MAGPEASSLTHRRKTPVGPGLLFNLRRSRNREHPLYWRQGKAALELTPLNHQLRRSANKMNYSKMDSVQESNQSESLYSGRESNLANSRDSGAQTQTAANDAASTSTSKPRVYISDVCTLDDLIRLIKHAHEVGAINLSRGHMAGRLPVWNAAAALVVNHRVKEELVKATIRELMDAMRNPALPAIGADTHETQWAAAIHTACRVSWCGIGVLVNLVSPIDKNWRKAVLTGSKRKRALDRMGEILELPDSQKIWDFPYLAVHGLKVPGWHFYVAGDSGYCRFTDVEGDPVYVERIFPKKGGGWDKIPEVDRGELTGLKNGTVCSFPTLYPCDGLDGVVVLEGVRDQLATLDAFEKCGDDRFNDRWTIFSSGSCGNIPHVVAAVFACDEKVKVTVLVDRDPVSLTGPRMAMKLHEKWGDRVRFALPPVGFKDADDVRWNHGACDGHAALVQLVDSAEWVPSAAALAEISGRGEEERASGHRDADNVACIGEARRKRQGKASGGNAGKPAPEAVREPWERTLEDGALDCLPGLVRRCLACLVPALGLGSEMELCCRIEFDPLRFCQVAGAVALQQKDRRYLVLTPAGEFRTFLPGELGLGIDEALGGFYDRVKLRGLLEAAFPEGKAAESQRQAVIKELLGVIDLAFAQYITNERQYTDIAIETDMFLSHAQMAIRDGRAYISIPHAPFDESIGFDIPERERELILADYRQHWPMFDEFISVLVAARFAAARKKAYLWLRAPSDWGKGLLAGVLGRLGLITDLTTAELERLFSGQPCGLQMTDFRRSWVLSFNEFRSAKAELKVLEQSIRFSPKNMPVCEVPLYLKLFTSAENVESLVSQKSGVEDQFANRFSLIEPEGESIDTRHLFTAGRGTYRDALAGFLARDLNRRVDEYRSLGRRGAEDRGDAFLAEFHHRHGIGNSYTPLSKRIPELCIEFRKWVIACWQTARSKMDDSRQGLKMLTKDERLVWEHAKEREELYGHMYGAVLYLTSSDRVLKCWLEAEFHQGERGKLTMKSAAFRRHLPPVTRPRFDSVQVKAMLMGPVGYDFDA